MRNHASAAFWAVACLYLLLAFGYNLATPYRTAAAYRGIELHDIGAPDEIAHVNYLRALAKGFPVMRADAGENYEAHQPPAYYILAAPFAAIGHAISESSEGLFARLVSILLGLITLNFVWRIAWLLRPVLSFAVAATSLAMLMPMQLAMFASVNNDGLTELWFAMGLWQSVRMLRDGVNEHNCVMMGCVLGLAMLTKTTGLLLAPLLVLAMFLSPAKGSRITAVGTMLLVGFAIASPWLIRNQVLYGDPLAMGIFKKAFASTFTREIAQTTYGYDLSAYFVHFTLWYTFRSFWGAFGYLVLSWPLWLPEGLYRALMVVSAVMAFGVIMWLAREADPIIRRAAALMVALFTMVSASFLLFNLTYAQGQGRYFSPAMPAIAFAVASGWRLLVPSRFANKADWVLAGGVGALAVYALVGVIWPGFRGILGGN